MTHEGTKYEHSETKASFDQRNQWHWCGLCNDWFLRHDPINIMVGVCREDNPADVDEAYGAGTYERLFGKFIIQKIEGTDVWSNADGWIDEGSPDVTIFDADERESFDLPINGEWVRHEV